MKNIFLMFFKLEKGLVGTENVPLLCKNRVRLEAQPES